MKRILITLAGLLLLSGAATAQVAREDLKQIRALVANGHYQQALEQHLWFHEASKTSPGMGGVRLSYALVDWLALAERYPPALTALVALRDADQARLLEGAGHFNDFQDLAAINRTLHEDDKTVALFVALDSAFPEQSNHYYIVAEELLFAAKYYQLCAKYMGDPLYKYESVRQLRELQLSLAKTDPKFNNADFLEYTDERFDESVARLLEVLVAIDQREAAMEIQQLALAYHASDRIRLAL
ncbi:hypothetical protein [Halioxenophilus sp. WMMB6]|uniref:hypothetical protein n=1 Tax=Halioxenophilus sp. WMMB6 TaxID=3073815 RepID=UPI00295F5608|nr:hypothetical protein [Halioxenophilus sp. WMMB6]